MTSARKKRKKPQTPGGRWRRRCALGFALIALAVVVFVSLTEPRQLPARVADHAATRTVYLWRDKIAAAVNRQIYPLAHLRSDAPAAPGHEVGYDREDRDALESLIKQKDATQ